MRSDRRGAVGFHWPVPTRGAAGRRGDIVLKRIYVRLAWAVTRDEHGATAVEYGLIIVFIAAVVAVALPVMGSHIKQAFVGVIKGF